MTKTIKVTKADIAAGIPGDAYSCPVALALIRSGLEDTRVRRESIWITNKGKTILITLPTKVKAFTRRFDAGKPVKSLSFTLRTI